MGVRWHIFLRSIFLQNLSNSAADLSVWHRGITHLNKAAIKQLAKITSEMTLTPSSSTLLFCSVCVEDKITRQTPLYYRWIPVARLQWRRRKYLCHISRFSLFCSFCLRGNRLRLGEISQEKISGASCISKSCHSPKDSGLYSSHRLWRVEFWGSR